MQRPMDLGDDFAVAGQLEPEDFAALKAAGFRTIINNRPDDEEPGQIAAEKAARLARENGMEYRFIPVSGSNFSQEKLRAMQRAMDELPRPMLAHCRSGRRSTVLWALAMARGGRAPVDELIRRAGVHGIDLEELRAALRALSPDTPSS